MTRPKKSATVACGARSVVIINGKRYAVGDIIDGTTNFLVIEPMDMVLDVNGLQDWANKKSSKYRVCLDFCAKVCANHKEVIVKTVAHKFGADGHFYFCECSVGGAVFKFGLPGEYLENAQTRRLNKPSANQSQIVSSAMS